LNFLATKGNYYARLLN